MKNIFLPGFLSRYLYTAGPRQKQGVAVDCLLYINLDFRRDRLAHIVEQLKPCPWLHERIPAVRLSTSPDEAGYQLRPGLERRPHVASIFLSHRKALSRALELARRGTIIVVEDDVSINPQFFSTPFHLPPSLPDDWEIVLLSPRYRRRATGNSSPGTKTPWLKKPFGCLPILLRDAHKQFLCSGCHFCVFRDPDAVAKALALMNALDRLYDVDGFYRDTMQAYGLHHDFIATAPFGSDHS